MPTIDFAPEAVDGVGKWYINAPTIPGWHYQLEQLSADGLSWTPAVFWYGNGQPLRHFVTDGPLPPSGGPYGPPPPGTPTWQLRFVEFKLELPANGVAGSVRISRAATHYPGNPPVPVAAWDHYLTGETFPAMAAGSRWFLFQSWEDRANRILWHTEFQVTAYASASSVPANSLAVTPQQAGELVVWQNIKDQLTGAMTAPEAPPEPPAPSNRKLLRLRRTSIDTNSNGIPDWWELAHNWKPFALAGQTGYFDPAGDADGDGLSNLAEFRTGSDYLLTDTDGDSSPDNRDTDPSDPARHPAVFDTLWHGLGGEWYSNQGSGQTGWASRNWGAPQDFTPVISSWTTPSVARQQLVASVNWPAGDDFSQAQKLPDVPQVAEFRWDRYPFTGGQYSSSAQIYERKIRARRDAAQSWEQRHTLLRLVLPVTADYQREFSVGAITSYEKTDLVIPAGQKVSPALELRIPASDTLWNTGQGNLHRRHYFTELHRIPQVLPVNADFDEGRTDSQTGLPLPDCADNSLVRLTEFPWRPGDKIGGPVLDDLHPGWFGIRPDAFKVDQNVFPGDPIPGSFYDGVSIKIRKLSRTDSSTGLPESGHVRFWITKGDAGSAVWQQHVIEAYNRQDPAWPATELTGWVYGPSATVPGPAPDVRYWVEGLAPGKCTLEFKCVRGPHTIIHEQTFEVACHWTPDQWRQIARHYIYLDSKKARGGTGPAVDMDTLDIGKGFMPHRDHARAIYQFYGSLFFDRPDEFLWTGLAKRAGSGVYWGLSDSQHALETWPTSVIPATTETALAFQKALLTGMRDVYRDVGWQFIAYHVGGISSMKYLYQEGNISEAIIAAWENMAEGSRLNQQVLIDNASASIARQEQEIVLAPAFSMIALIKAGGVPISWILSKFSKNPVPGALSFSQFNPNGNITNFTDRWPWIQDPFSGMLLKWRQKGNWDRADLVFPYIEDLAEALSFADGFGLYIK